jgi:hypothetical protein
MKTIQIEKKRKMTSLLSLTLLIILAASAVCSTIVYGQPTVSVTIGYPSNPHDLGITSGGHWIGEFPITVTSGTSSYGAEVYCFTSGGTVYQGSTYPATLVPVPDNDQWRQVAYILTWNAPTDNNGAALDQIAMWHILDSYYDPVQYGLQSFETQATSLVNNATGKDVVRPGDQLTWVSPSSGAITASPGTPVMFQVQLKNSTDAPRPNVQINFSAELTSPSGQNSTLGAPYISWAQSFTDSSGMAQVTVTVPSNTAYGSSIIVMASTHGIWPEQYIDLTSQTPGTQELLGTGTGFNLSSSTNIYIIASIFVLPENAFGVLGGIVTFVAAFATCVKLNHHRNKRKT